ncbi:hypothetical protein PMAYCL1PPCAC_09512, partial [Pristionchus mayeri]
VECLYLDSVCRFGITSVNIRLIVKEAFYKFLKSFFPRNWKKIKQQWSLDVVIPLSQAIDLLSRMFCTATQIKTLNVWDLDDDTFDTFRKLMRAVPIDYIKFNSTHLHLNRRIMIIELLRNHRVYEFDLSGNEVDEFQLSEFIRTVPASVAGFNIEVDASCGSKL